jgi:hypothetical protein
MSKREDSKMERHVNDAFVEESVVNHRHLFVTDKAEHPDAGKALNKFGPSC